MSAESYVNENFSFIAYATYRVDIMTALSIKCADVDTITKVAKSANVINDRRLFPLHSDCGYGDV